MFEKLNPIYAELERKPLESLTDTDIRAITVCHMHVQERDRQICYDGFREGIAHSLTKIQERRLPVQNDY